jgi:PAS domain S-box-containing protein
MLAEWLRPGQPGAARSAWLLAAWLAGEEGDGTGTLGMALFVLAALLLFWNLLLLRRAWARKQAVADLQVAEARFRTIIESNAIAVFFADVAGPIRDANDAFLALVGYTREDLHAGLINWRTMTPPEGAARDTLALEELAASGVCAPFEKVFLRRDGTAVPVLIGASFPRDVNDHGLCFVLDLTERKRAEDALRRSEERLRLALRAARLGGWEWDIAADQVTYTDELGPVFGLPTGSNHPSYASFLATVHPGDRDRLARTITQSLEAGTEFGEEFRVVWPDGTTHWVSNRGRVYHDEAGRPVRMAGVAMDVSERRQAEETRRGLERERDDLLDRLQLHLRRMPIGYLLTGPDFRYLDWNPAAERIFGYSRDEVVGRHPFEVIVPPAAQPEVSALFDRLRAGDMTAQRTGDNVTKDGRIITCEWRNTPLFGSDGAFTGLLSMAQDVTDRRALEEQLRQAHKMEAVGRLAGGVAHDFNNLLTIVTGYTELLLEQAKPGDPATDSLREIKNAAGRAGELTRQLLAFSRRQVLAPVVHDVNTTVADLERMLRRLIGEDVELVTALAPALGKVRADPGQLEQVLVNLAVNARDAMPQGGRLTVSTANVEGGPARPGRYVALTVRDTGCGMDSTTRTRMFEPFFTTKAVGKGTGLGLATVYGIVEQSGGHLVVDSEPNRGTAVTVLLPRLEQAETQREPHALAPAARSGTETVLLVEDEEAVRGLVRRVLERQGYTVLEASQGAEGLEICERHPGPIHLLVTDIVMPVMGGGELVKRALARRPDLKVLCITGYTDDALVQQSLPGMTAAFLHKPFTPEELGRRVGETLDPDPPSSLA